MVLTDDNLMEEQANRLLKDAHALGRQEGIYTEVQLARRTRSEYVDSDLVSQAISTARAEIDNLVVGELRHLGNLAGLSDPQQDVWNLRVLGLGVEEIAETCGISRSSTYARLERARFKVIKAMIRYPYFGLWDVYTQLIRRSGKR